MPPRPPALITLPRSVRVLLRESGVDLEAHARALGLPSASERLSPAQAEALMDRVLRAVGEPGIGLRLGAEIRPELFGLAGLTAMAAPTLGQALARLERYKRLFSPDWLELAEDPEGTAVRVRLGTPGAWDRQRADLELAFVVAFARRMTGASLRPRRLALRGAPPPHRARYRELFGCAPQFAAEHDELVLSPLDLARPLLGGSAELSALISPEAERLLAESGAERPEERVRAALRRALHGERPTLASVARALGVSARSLQRRLEEAGTSFGALLDEARRDVAREHLARSEASPAEISFLLGFASPNSFYRAFRRWEGVSPLAYRRGQIVSPALKGGAKRRQAR